MPGFVFTPASKPAGWARVALVGPPGSGCEYTALTLAGGFGGPVGVVDTSHGVGNQYAHLFDYSTVTPHTFDPRTLTEAVAHAADQGIATLVVPLSPWWSGEGGMLEAVDKQAGGSRDKNAGWDKMRPVERDMTRALLTFPGHLIGTVETKVDWVTEADESGRVVTRPHGTKPDQRGDLLNDFHLAITMAAGTGIVVASKYPALTGRIVHHPGEVFAAEILKAVADGAVGEPYSPIVERDWILSPDRTDADELLTRLYDLRDRRRETTVVIVDGQATTLEAVCIKRGSALRHAAAGTTPIANPLADETATP